jgi:hypothetical protein
VKQVEELQELQGLGQHTSMGFLHLGRRRFVVIMEQRPEDEAD